MLAATADRERALDVLKAGFAEGRLTREEHEARAGGVQSARTYGELAALTGDLPGGQWAVQSWQQPPWQPPPAPRADPVATAALIALLMVLLLGLLAVLAG
jgi:hypothetical protein